MCWKGTARWEGLVTKGSIGEVGANLILRRYLKVRRAREARSCHLFLLFSVQREDLHVDALLEPRL